MNYIRKVQEGRNKKLKIKPNKPEKIIIDIIKDLNLQDLYVYVGDYSFCIERFNPDFINIKDKKIIEFYGDYWHTLKKSIVNDIRRSKIYNEHGYKLLVIWEKELNNIKLLKNKIVNFHTDNYGKESK